MQYGVLWTSLIVVALATSPPVEEPLYEDYLCPENEPAGKFPDEFYCDAYWHCEDNVPTFIDCADGFGFDPDRVETQKEPCDYLFKVNCTGREQLATPAGTGVCKRKNGIYPHEDPDVCNEFYSCRNDKPEKQTCPPGLHFRLDTRTCDWPEPANRGACQVKKTVKPGQFECDPTVEFFTPAKQKILHPTFAFDDDCRKFYVCLNGLTRQLSRCVHGKVYSIEKATCDIPLNVPGCEDYYQEENQ